MSKSLLLAVSSLFMAVAIFSSFSAVVEVSGALVTLTPQNIQNFLDAHNNIRRNVNPPAQTPLPNVVWDAALQASAENNVRSCVFAHNSGNYGENLGGGTGYPASGWEALAVDDWASEASGYDYYTGSCSIWACGHYTQLVWANTVRIGCARVDGCPNFPQSIVSCQYDPPGNYYGQFPYVAASGPQQEPESPSETSVPKPSESETSTFQPSESGTETKTETETATHSAQVSISGSRTVQPSATTTTTETATNSVQPSESGTKTQTETQTETASISQTILPSQSVIPKGAEEEEETASYSPTSSDSATNSATKKASKTRTKKRTATSSAQASATTTATATSSTTTTRTETPTQTVTEMGTKSKLLRSKKIVPSSSPSPSDFNTIKSNPVIEGTEEQNLLFLCRQECTIQYLSCKSKTRKTRPCRAVKKACNSECNSA
jgi:pathogenesis-related protein 1